MKNLRNIEKKAPTGEKILAKNVFYIEGASVLKDYARLAPQKVKDVFIYGENGVGGKDDGFKEVCRKVGWNLIQITKRPELVKSAVWAEVAIEMQSEQGLFARIAKESQPLLLALDHITDPRNLGAIARSAAFFGLRSLIVPKDRQVLLTRASVDTAQGGFALVELCQVTNLVRCLKELKKQGYWVLGADAKGDVLSPGVRPFDKMVLVLGAEDKGLSELVRRECDVLISIQGAEKRLDSLNVSVAAGILINKLKA